MRRGEEDLLAAILKHDGVESDAIGMKKGTSGWSLNVPVFRRTGR